MQGKYYGAPYFYPWYFFLVFEGRQSKISRRQLSQPLTTSIGSWGFLLGSLVIWIKEKSAPRATAARPLNSNFLLLHSFSSVFSTSISDDFIFIIYLLPCTFSYSFLFFDTVCHSHFLISSPKISSLQYWQKCWINCTFIRQVLSWPVIVISQVSANLHMQESMSHRDKEIVVSNVTVSCHAVLEKRGYRLLGTQLWVLYFLNFEFLN